MIITRKGKMENKIRLEEFLFSMNFKIVVEETSEYFGDFYCIYSNCGEVEFRIVSDRGLISIGVKNNKNENNWYDMELVKRMLEDKRRVVLEGGEAIEYLKQNFDEICILFSDKEYSSTKMILNQLQRDIEIFF